MLEVVKTSKGICLSGGIRMFSNDSEKKVRRIFIKGNFLLGRKNDVGNRKFFSLEAKTS